MTWKIKQLIPQGESPILHMWDQSVNVHLVTHLDSGTVDLYIGADEPSRSTCWFSIDSERDIPVKLEHCDNPSQLQQRVIQTILGTMRLDFRQLMRLVRMSARPMSDRPIPKNQRSFFDEGNPDDPHNHH